MSSASSHEGRLEQVLATPPISPDLGVPLGRSREGQPIHGFRIGRPGLRVSLLGGCHADEPVGPRLLRRLAGYLSSLPEEDPLVAEHEWWILPHINPDGEARNRSWSEPGATSYELPSYLAAVVREPPGDDIEFGFPRNTEDTGARPENRCAYDWWAGAEGTFDLHVSLHGIGFAAGPWFLLDRDWALHCGHLMRTCADRTRALGYRLHDVERRGEKGFERIDPGFCTRPDSAAMRAFFEARGDHETARLFRPSSMETIRVFGEALGGDPLTLVSEMPLFLIPGVGECLGPPDPVADRWKERIEGWRQMLADAAEGEWVGTEARVREEAAEADLRPMPVRDQQALQWTFITAGVDEVKSRRGKVPSG